MGNSDSFEDRRRHRRKMDPLFKHAVTVGVAAFLILLLLGAASIGLLAHAQRETDSRVSWLERQSRQAAELAKLQGT